MEFAARIMMDTLGEDVVLYLFSAVHGKGGNRKRVLRASTTDRKLPGSAGGAHNGISVGLHTDDV
jgi:hypothetical protein